MSWYYAGPEAKPVGPVSLEELQALRAKGSILPETFVLEQTGQPVGTLAWRRYQEIFSELPPMPAPALFPPAPLAAIAPPSPQPHPLFPSAAAAPTFPPVFASAPRPDPYYRVRTTNPFCAWGFGLGVVSFVLCGIGLFPALVAIPLCIIGLLQLSRRQEQKGQWLAISGLVLSGLALIIAFILIVSASMPFLKAHGLTVTEQTTNDSE